MVILVNIIIMFSSFFIAYFVKDITMMIVNGNLILYSMFFLLTPVEYLSSIFVNRSWYLLFCAICKSKKTWKMAFNFIEFSDFWLFYKTFQVLVSTILSDFPSFECLCKCCFDPNQRESLSTCKLCKDDNKLKA